MDELKQAQQDIREIAGYVQTLAKAVLRKEDDAGDEYEDDMEKDFGMDDEFGGEEEEVLPMDDFGGDEDNEYMDMAVEEPEGADWGTGDFEAAYKAIKMLQKRQARKGYAASAKTNVDEHDAPFGEKDSDTGGGNEAIEAGTQGGDRADETFGPGGMAYSAMKKELSQVKGLLKQVAAAQGGTTIAKAITPAGGSQKGEEADSNILTREMQQDYKKLSYRQINAHRTQVGDLPENLITGV